MKRQKMLMVGFVFLVLFNIFSIFPTSKMISNETNQTGTDSSPDKPTTAEMENRELVNDTGFSFGQDHWNYSISSIDPSDIAANISGSGSTGEANYIIQGHQQTISITEKNWSATPWNAMVNPELRVWPQDKETGYPTYFFDEKVWSASHSWAENRNGANGSAGIIYKRNYTLPLNLSDYKITAIALDASFNASIDPGTGQTGIEVIGEGDYGAIYDFARVYLEVSNLEQTSVYQLLSNTTGLLGKDLFPTIMNSTHLDLTYPDDILIAYLTNALSSGDYQNITISLGIDFHCEKNSASDVDTWYQVVINNFTLSFTVRKQINQQAAASWYQDEYYLKNGLIMLDAFLTFDYKVSTTWPTSSPNSEFRVWINGGMSGETVPLSGAETMPKAANIRIDQLHQDMLVNLSIEVYIGDNFLYDNNLTVTIDNVHLNATWNTTTPLLATNPLKLILNGTDRSSDPAITVPEGFFVNLTVIYTDDSSVFLPSATVSISTARFSTTVNKDTDHDQYTYLLNASADLYPGINYLSITAVQDGYREQKQDPTASVFLRNVQTNITSATGSNIINIAPESDAYLNITLIDLDRNESIKDAQVYFNSEVDSGILTDLDNDGSYEGWITNVPAGSYPVTITATSSGPYDWTEYVLTLNADNALLNQTVYVLLINGTDYTIAPVYTVPIQTMVNITVKYTNQSLGYIPDAFVQLTRLGYIDDFDPDIADGQYTLILNSSMDFVGGTNNLVLKARKAGYTSNSSNLQINVRAYKTALSLVDETSVDRIDIKPGNTVTVKIRLGNYDLGTVIKGKTVIFSWQFGEGTMTDSDNDGIYETTFENVPEGSYPVLITVSSDANYEFETFDFTVAAMRTPDEIFMQNMILIIAIAGAVIFGGYFALYQLKWKYPPFVRLIRNVRKDVKKGRKLTASLGIESRTDLVENLIQKDTAIVGIKRKSYLTAVELPAARKTEKPQVKKVEKVVDIKKPTSVPPQTKGKIKEKTEKGKPEKGQKPEVKPTDAKPGEKAPAEKMQKPEVKPAIAKLGEKAPAEKSGVEPTKQPEVKQTEVKSEIKPKTENISAETGKKQEAKPAEPKSEVPPTPTESKTQPPSNPAQSPNPKKESKESKPDTNNTKDGK